MSIFGTFAGLRAGNQSDNTWTGKIFSIYSKDIWMYNVIFTVTNFFFRLSRKALAAATLVRMEEHVWTFSTHITVFVPATGLWVQQTCRRTHKRTHTIIHNDHSDSPGRVRVRVEGRISFPVTCWTQTGCQVYVGSWQSEMKNFSQIKQILMINKISC